MTGQFLTNCPKAAKAFKRANRAEQKARTAATKLCLADKLIALRTARETRERAFKAILHGWEIIANKHPERYNMLSLASGYTAGGILGLTLQQVDQFIERRGDISPCGAL